MKKYEKPIIEYVDFKLTNLIMEDGNLGDGTFTGSEQVDDFG